MWMIKEDFIKQFGDLKVDTINGDFIKYEIYDRR